MELLGQIALKEEAAHLASICMHIFEIILDNGFVLQAWKMSTIVHVPIIAHAKVMNEFRPDYLQS